MSTVLPTPRSVAAGLRLHVIGQRDAQVVLSVAIVNHLRRLTYRAGADGVQEFNKENVLIVGPTGCGKTHLVRTLARMVDLPVTMGDATKITQAGYVGGDVEDLLIDLWNKSGQNLERAQRGIVFLDEVDKIRAQNTEPDVNGQGVQRALLTLFNGTIVKLKTPKGEVKFDTKDVLFICAGAFVGLDQIIEKRTRGESRMGFVANVIARETDKIKLLRLMQQVNSDDLVDFGFIPEFVGRLPVRTAVMPLTEDELFRVLTEPVDSLVKQQRELLASEAEIVFSDDALRTIAHEAYSFGTGARALQQIVQEVMLPISFAPVAKRIVVSADMVRDRKELLTRLTADEDFTGDAEPCRISWDAINEQINPPQNEVSQSLVVTAQLVEAHRNTSEFGYIRWLRHVETGQGLYHIHRENIYGTCGTCGHKTQGLVWDRFVVCPEDIDPISRITDEHKQITWKCEGCGKSIDSTFTPSESEWRKAVS